MNFRLRNRRLLQTVRETKIFISFGKLLTSRILSSWIFRARCFSKMVTKM